MGFLRVLRLRGVVAGRVGEEVRAVALRDHRAGGLQCRVRQRGAVGSHIGDVALFVEALGSPHRHLRAHPELAARLLLVGRGDERCGGTATVGLRLTSADLVGHAVERADQRLGPSLVEHGDVVASEATVITEVATARQPNPVDRVERRRELALVVTLRCGERALHVPVAGLDERHAFAFTFDDDAGGDRLHTAGRQLRHHLLPEHRADLVAVKAVEDAAGLLGIDHLAVEFARRLHGKLDGVLGDLVEHHPLDGHVGAGVEHLDQVPGDRLTLTILIGREIELVGLLQQRLQETNVILLVAVLHVQRLEPVVDVDAGAGPRFTLVGLRHVGGVARQVADVADRRLDRELGTQVLLDLLGLGRALDDDERIGHQWVSAGSGWGGSSGSDASAPVAGLAQKSTSEPRVAAITDAPRMPSFASSTTIGSSNARPVMNNDTVKPMPAMRARPTTWRKVAPCGRPARPSRTPSQVNSETPTNLPTIRPSTTPRVMSLVTASSRVSEEISIPAFTRANNGMIRYELNG